MKGRQMGKAERRRGADRVATRLKPGKLLAPDGKFLADCAITDRSGSGARVRVFGEVGLRTRMILYDETGIVAWPTRLAWDDGSQAGLAFLAGPQEVPPDLAGRLSGRYYAVPD